MAGWARWRLQWRGFHLEEDDEFDCWGIELDLVSATPLLTERVVLEVDKVAEDVLEDVVDSSPHGSVILGVSLQAYCGRSPRFITFAFSES